MLGFLAVPADLGAGLKLMWSGMGGIFIVLIVIALIVLLLTKVTSKAPKE